jgi:hypothetical protein
LRYFEKERILKGKRRQVAALQKRNGKSRRKNGSERDGSMTVPP